MADQQQGQYSYSDAPSQYDAFAQPYGITGQQYVQLLNQYPPVYQAANQGGAYGFDPGGSMQQNPQLTGILNNLQAMKSLGLTSGSGGQGSGGQQISPGPIAQQDTARALGAYAMGQSWNPYGQQTPYVASTLGKPQGDVTYIKQQIPNTGQQTQGGIYQVGQEQLGQAKAVDVQTANQQAFSVPGVVGGSATGWPYQGTVYGSVSPTQGGAPTPTAYPTAAAVQQGVPWATAPAQPTSVPGNPSIAARPMMAGGPPPTAPGAGATKMPRMADGGVAAGPAIVGEKGKEMIIPSGPTQVIPLHGKDQKSLPHMQDGGTLYPGMTYGDVAGYQSPTYTGYVDPAILAAYGGYRAPPAPKGVPPKMTNVSQTGGSSYKTVQPQRLPPPPQAGPSMGASILNAVGSAIGSIGGAIGMGAHPAAAPGAVAQEAASNVNVPAPTGNVTNLTPGVEAINPLSGYGMPGGRPTPNWTPSMIAQYQGGTIPSAFQQGWANASPWANTRLNPADAAVMNQATATPQQAMTPMQRWQQIAQAGQRQQQPQQQPQGQPAPIVPAPMGAEGSGMGSYLGPYGYIPLQQKQQ